jgi:hypothetical protein
VWAACGVWSTCIEDRAWPVPGCLFLGQECQEASLPTILRFVAGFGVRLAYSFVYTAAEFLSAARAPGMGAGSEGARARRRAFAWGSRSDLTCGFWLKRRLCRLLLETATGPREAIQYLSNVTTRL